MTTGTDGLVVAPGAGKTYGCAGAWTLMTVAIRRERPRRAGDHSAVVRGGGGDPHADRWDDLRPAGNAWAGGGERIGAPGERSHGRWRGAQRGGVQVAVLVLATTSALAGAA